MTDLAEVLSVLCELAPPETALPDDPVGLLLGGDLDAAVEKIGVCLDATPAIARRAAAEHVHLLIAHHPLIYLPLKRLASDPISQAVTTLVKADIALYAMHTNWDSADGGINDTLAGLLDLKNVRRLGEHGLEALPRLGDLPEPRTLADFTRLVHEAIACTGMCALRVNEIDLNTIISRVAVCGGAGAELAAAVQAAGADAYVTSDVRHHEFLDATGRGLALYDAGHQATEAPGMRVLVPRLAAKLPAIKMIWMGEECAE
jgi:dinuclear metal center YbgI/SA1388 family protein